MYRNCVCDAALLPHADLRDLVECVFAWLRAIGERETCVRERGVLLVIGGVHKAWRSVCTVVFSLWRTGR